MLRFLRVMHRWLGLVLVLPMLLQGLSGTVLALTPIYEDWRPVPAIAAGPPKPASAIVAAAAMPGLLPVRYVPPIEAAPATVELGVAGQRGASERLMIDPASLAVLATGQPSGFYRWVHTLHEHLLMPALGGRSIIGWFGVGLLVLGLSGLVLWWPAPGRWRAALTVSGRAKGARLQRELHGAAGFWLSGMLVLMSVSGITMTFPQTIGAALGLPSGMAQQRGDGQRGGGREAFDLDAVLAKAAETLPGATITDVRLPNPPGRPVLVMMRMPGSISGAPATMLTIDPAGQRVITSRDPRTMGTAALTLAWLRSLHTAEAFGLPWQVLVTLTGLVLPLMAVTGAALWLLKRRNRLRLAGQRRAALAGGLPQ